MAQFDINSGAISYIFGANPNGAYGAKAVVPVSDAGVPIGGPFRKAVPITPGTPVAPGRCVWVRSINASEKTVALVLADGGTVLVWAGPPGSIDMYLYNYSAIDVSLAQGTAAAGSFVVVNLY